MRGRFTYSLGQSGPGQGSPTRVHVTRSEWTRTRVPDEGACHSVRVDPDKGRTGTRTRVSRGPGQGSPTRVHVVCQTEKSGPCKSPNLSLSVIGLRGYSIYSRVSPSGPMLTCVMQRYGSIHFTKSVFMFSDEIK